MPADAPRALMELGVLASAGDRVGASLEPACRWLAAGEAIDAAAFAHAAPDVVLLEVGATGPRPGAQRLASLARRAGVASALWLTGSTRVCPATAELAGTVDAVFGVDPGRWPDLPAIADRPLIGAQHAASRAALATPRAQIASRVGLVVEPGAAGDDPLSPRFRAMVDAVAEEHDVELFAAEQAGDGASGERARAAFIAGCGVLLAGAGPGASWLHVPAAVFDAVAIGTPVVTSYTRGAALSLPRMAGLAKTPEDARAMVAAALEHGELPPGRRAAGRTAVRHEHTYAHRLATIASSFGHRLLPPVGSPAC